MTLLDRQRWDFFTLTERCQRLVIQCASLPPLTTTLNYVVVGTKTSSPQPLRNLSKIFPLHVRVRELARGGGREMVLKWWSNEPRLTWVLEKFQARLWSRVTASNLYCAISLIKLLNSLVWLFFLPKNHKFRIRPLLINLIRLDQKVWWLHSPQIFRQQSRNRHLTSHDPFIRRNILSNCKDLRCWEQREFAFVTKSSGRKPYHVVLILEVNEFLGNFQENSQMQLISSRHSEKIRPRL